MKIAVDTRHLGNNSPAEYGYFLGGILNRITRGSPGDEFIFIFDRPYNTKVSFDKNVTALVTGPATSNTLLLKFWYDVKIPALLKKHKVDIFISGPGICSLTTRTPQCLIIDHLSFLQFPSLIRKTELFFLKRYTKKFLKRANSIVTVSELLKSEIVNRYAIEKEKVSVVYGSAETFFPLNENVKEEVRRKHTGGKNYFIYTGGIDKRKNLINLLKGFSMFKKRQKSDWKLVLTGPLSPRYRSFEQKLSTYKYRHDIILTGYLEEQEFAALTGSAYALIFPLPVGEPGAQVLTAMASHVPVISSLNSTTEEIAGEAALYVNPADHKDIADKLMLLYKDESLRNSLVEKGKIVAGRYTWEKATTLFRQAILNALQ